MPEPIPGYDLWKMTEPECRQSCKSYLCPFPGCPGQRDDGDRADEGHDEEGDK